MLVGQHGLAGFARPGFAILDTGDQPSLCFGHIAAYVGVASILVTKLVLAGQAGLTTPIIITFPSMLYCR